MAIVLNKYAKSATFHACSVPVLPQTNVLFVTRICIFKLMGPAFLPVLHKDNSRILLIENALYVIQRVSVVADHHKMIAQNVRLIYI